MFINQGGLVNVKSICAICMLFEFFNVYFHRISHVFHEYGRVFVFLQVHYKIHVCVYVELKGKPSV